MKSKVPISESEYHNRGFHSSVKILEMESARKLWRKHIDAKAKHFFEIEFGSWLDSGRSLIYDNWVKNFNEGDAIPLQNKLLQLDWCKDDTIYYIWDSTAAFETKWSEFIQNWMVYLEFEDDCPIIYNSNKNRTYRALVFSPRGMLFAHKKKLH